MTISIENTLYSVGDKVLVKQLENGKEYFMHIDNTHGNKANEPMLEFSNKIVTIGEVFDLADVIKEALEIPQGEEIPSNISYGIEEDETSQLMKLFTGFQLGYADEMFVGKLVPLAEYSATIDFGKLYTVEIDGKLTPIKVLEVVPNHFEYTNVIHAEEVGSKKPIELKYKMDEVFEVDKWYAIVDLTKSVAVADEEVIETTEDSLEVEVVEEQALLHNDFYIEKVIYNNPVTVVFYREVYSVDHENGAVGADTKLRKVTSRLMDGDVYDKEIGLEICLNKMVKREADRKLKELYKGNI